MKFIFVDQQTSKPYTVSTPRKEALGGSQSAICYYAGALAKLGHEVILVNQINSPTLDDGVHVKPAQWYFEQRRYECDIIILCSAVFPAYFDVIEQNFRYKLSMCWQGHFGTEPPLALAKSYLFHVDLFAFVSEYQRNHFCRHFNLPIEKTVLMLNGISPFFHDVDITQKTDTCIYFSNPGRGLYALPDIWPLIHKQHPNAKLEIFSSNTTYGGQDSPRTTEVKKQLRLMPHVTVFDSAGQDVLAEHCAKSAFLLYPTHFVETSCIVCLESSAAGALPLVTDMGVFPEYVNNCIHYGPNFEQHYAKKACEAFDQFYKQRKVFNANSLALSTAMRTKHNYVTLAKELIENCRKFRDIKARSILRQKETVENDMGCIYAGESTPLFFETKVDAANYFLQHGNKLLASDYYRSAEQHYLRSWDIMHSVAAASNIIVYYIKQKDYESALLWMRKMLRFEVKPITMESIMNNYKSLDFSSRIGLLEYIRTLFSNTQNPSHRYMYLRTLGILAGQYRMLMRHDDALKLQYEIVTTLQNPSYNIDEKRNLLQATLSTLMFASNYDFKKNHKNYIRDCLYYEQMITPIRHTSKVFSKQCNSKLKIGFLSADFCNHPVTYVLNGFVEHIDKSTAELYLLYMGPKADTFTAKSYLFKNIKHIVELSPNNKAAHITTIENLDLDILVDMCGHTSNNSQEAMDILRAKPARVICNYFAYPGTTGIQAIDFKIGDTIALPESSRTLFTEDFQHIDNGFHSYKPIYDIDIVKTNNAAVQFGVFNNPQKFTTAWLDTVATILQRIPDSHIHLCYAGFSDKSLQFYYHTELENRGISNARVFFHEASEFREYASLFENIDIALDTFPYNGGTVSIESIYFKTPYVSLLGEDYVARVGASILHQVGHPELVATSEEDYIEKAVSLAADRARIRNYHATLRNDLLRSTLGNGKAFAAHFMKAMAEMLEKKGFTNAPISVKASVENPVGTHNPWNFFKHRYVINLKDSVDRRAQVTEELTKVNMEFEFFDAIDGRKDFEFLRNYYLKKGLVTEEFAKNINPAELGCLLSHYKIYEKEYRQMGSDQYWILIMEDDITFSPKLTLQVLQAYMEHWPKQSRYVKLGFTNWFKDNMNDINPYFVELKKTTGWGGIYAVHTSVLHTLVNHTYNAPADCIYVPPMHACKSVQGESPEFYKANKVLFLGLCAERKGCESVIKLRNTTTSAPIQHYTKEDPLAITVGRSEENSIMIQLDKEYPLGTKFRMKPTQFFDEFETTIQGNTLRVTRTDAPGGWGYPHTGRIELPPQRNNPWEFFKRRYVISLKDSLNRRASVTEELKKVNMDFIFFDAIDGRKDFEFLMNDTIKNGILDKEAYTKLCPGELGCFLSHYKIYQKEYTQKGDKDYWILIMEDDIKFSSKLVDSLQNYIEYWPDTTNTVKLCYSSGGQSDYKVEINNEYFVQLKKQTWSAVCYAVHTSTLKRRIEKTYSSAIDVVEELPVHGFKSIPTESKEFYRIANLSNAYYEGVCGDKAVDLPSIISTSYGMNLPKKKDVVSNTDIVVIGTSQTNIKTIPLEYQPNDQLVLLKNPYKDAFDFKLDNNTLVVKRTDSDSGWAYSHKAMLYKTMPTEINVPATTDSPKIPKLLIQTYKDNVIHPALYNNTIDFLNRNKDFSYKLITDATGLQLIKDHFDKDTLWAFERLNVGAAKGDFLRYVALYVYGGVYLDLDSSIQTALSTYIQQDDEFIFFYDDANIEQNCFMIRPKHELLKAIIDEMVRRIYTKENNIFIATGPVLVTDVIYNTMKRTHVYNVASTVPQEEKVACWKSGPFMGGRFVYRPANDPHFQFKVEGYDESMMYNNHDNYHTNKTIVHSRLYKPNSFPKFHLSMTTIPSRFHSIYRTIDTLLQQTYKPESIIVNIPKTYGFRFNGISIPEEDISNFIKRYESSGKVRVNRVDEDYGPGTKLLGALDLKDIEDDSYIILVDDDVIYDDVLHEYLPCLSEYNTGSMNIQTYKEGFDNGPVYSGEGITTYLMKKSILNRFRDYYNVIRSEKTLAFHDDLYIAYYFHLLHEKPARVNKRNKFPCMYYRPDAGEIAPDSLSAMTGDLSRETISKKSVEILNRFTNEGRFSFFQKNVNTKDLCIISNNCYGAPYYSKYNIQYNTPFVSLYLFAPCYIELLEHFDEYMLETLEELTESKYGTFNYPMGRLKSVEIHFCHDDSFLSAKATWDRRKNRLLPIDDCVIKMCDRSGADESLLLRFLALQHKNKLLFISKRWNSVIDAKCDPSTIVVKIPESYSECPDGYKLESMYPIHTLIANNSVLGRRNVKKSKVGVFLRQQNFYSNGAGMHAVFLLQSLSALGYDVDCITNIDATKSPVICDRLPYTYKDMNSCDYKEYSAILFGTLVPPESEQKKIKDAGVKILMFHPCNSYDGFHNEHFLYPSKSTTMPLFEATFQNYADTVLIPDNNAKYASTYVGTLNQNKVAMKSLRWTWHPLFLYKNNRIPRYLPRKAEQKLDIVIIEPNLGYCKCGWLPLVIAERFNKLNPSILNSVYYYMQPAEGTEAQAMIQSLQLWKDSKVKLYPRVPINDILNHFGDGKLNDNHRVVFLSHNINSEMNYAYLDILYTGFPFIHNSRVLQEKAQGYYYDTVEDGANAIRKALEHDPVQARNGAKGFFEHIDPFNPSFLKELDTLFEPAKNYQFIVISCDKDRRNVMDAQFAQMNVEVPIHYIEPYMLKNSKDYLPNEEESQVLLSICAARSHLRSLEYAVRDESPEFSIIMEDDLLFRKTNTIDAIEEIIAKWDSVVAPDKMCQLGFVPTRNYEYYKSIQCKHSLDSIKDSKCIRTIYEPGTQMYMIRKKDVLSYISDFIHPSFAHLCATLRKKYPMLTSDSHCVSADIFLTRILGSTILFPPIVIERVTSNTISSNNHTQYWDPFFKGCEERKKDYYEYTTGGISPSV